MTQEEAREIIRTHGLGYSTSEFIQALQIVEEDNELNTSKPEEKTVNMTREEIINALQDDKMMPFIQPDQLANIVDFVSEQAKKDTLERAIEWWRPRLCVTLKEGLTEGVLEEFRKAMED